MSTRAASVLIFELGQAAPPLEASLFGIDVTQVLHVFEPSTPSPVPLAPSIVLGIVNHHGRIVTVVDPGPILGIESTGLGGTESRVILLRRGELATGNVGLYVRQVHEIVPAAGLKAVDVPVAKCVEWVAQRGRHLINIVRVESLLAEIGREFSGPSPRESRRASVGAQ